MRIAVRALQAMEWQGRTVTPGEVWTVPPIEAAALRYRHKAEIVPLDDLIQAGAALVEDEAPVVVEDTHAPTRRRRRYRRRDLTAEGACDSSD